ncbi:nose resistant to fluoxetine protein 6-like [Toxorhynchites rutilus septentrionalis]|uniref:nose resistant to fluoxetine protein 6-like n=1 Tax=Toxorhynchites rutilus septentrionalis TaxID=329112 RepID=UPI002479E5A4|nr:nose resistant to fluoxetine protein 6-like [Toxorhynchites rutilus septentrionalis]
MKHSMHVRLSILSTAVWFGLCWRGVFAGSANVNDTLCDVQLHAAISGLSSKELWALQLFDSWGNWPSGKFYGNRYDFGNYDQCQGYTHDHAVGRINGRYCMVVITRESNLTNDGIQSRFFLNTEEIDGVGVGVCLPHVCSEQKSEALLKDIIKLKYNVEINNLSLQCDYGPIPLGSKRATAIIIFSICAFLVTTSTSYDIITAMASYPRTPALTSFSLYSNWKKMMRRTQSVKIEHRKSETFECIHGIRVLAILWIIFGHSYLLMLSAPLINPIAILDWFASPHSSLIIAGRISVDTFFLLSGLLTCWSLLKELDRSSQLNIPLMYLHRYLRLTPAFAALILFTVGVYPNISSGPLWNTSLRLSVDFCNEYWWSALLYVQNYVNPNQMCLGHSWYLSVDMQLFLLSPFIVYPLWKWGRKVLIIVGFLILFSMCYIIGVFFIYELRVNLLVSSLDRDKYSYQPTHTRMGAWFMGLIVGYILHQTKDRIVRLSKLHVTLGWILSGGIITACVFGSYPLNQPDSKQLPRIADALYESTKHVLWAASVGWIVFACTNGYGGLVNTILCWPIWQPLGKLSYCLYLLHLPIQTILTGSMRTVRHFSDFGTMHTFWGDFGFTMLAAIAWTLLFEIPFGNLDALLLRRAKSSDR